MLRTRKLWVTHNGADKNRDGEVNYNDETKEYRSKIERFVKRHIHQIDVENAILTGNIIEQYPDD